MTPDELAKRRTRANRAAWIATCVVFVGALLLLFIGLPAAIAAENALNQPTEISVTTHPSDKTTIETGGVTNGQPTPDKTTTEENTSGVETTRTDPDADRSLFGRAFENPATFWILQFLLALLAGFLAGGVTQRIYLGNYGIKIGQLEFEAIPDVTLDSAKRAADLITTVDVTGPQRQGAVAIKEVRWWVHPPRDSSTKDSLILAGIAVEAGVREIADRADVTKYSLFSETVTGLVTKDVIPRELGDGLERLVAIRNRMIAGAEVEAEATPVLSNALAHAIKALALTD